MENKFNSKNLKEIAESIINHTETLENICKKYNSDSRTIKFELLTYLQQEGNEQLLKEWLKTEPYKSKSGDIDYISVIKYILKNNSAIKDIREELEIPERTYTRNIAKLRDDKTIDGETGLTYSELMEIYERNKKNNQIYGDQEIIDKIQIQSDLGHYTRENKKIDKLINIIKDFEELILEGNSAEEAINLMQEERPGLTLKKLNVYQKEFSGISTQVYKNEEIELYK